MQDVAESSGNTVYSYHLGPSACAFLFANCIRLLRYSSKCRKRKVIHRCKLNCVQQQLSKYSSNCTIQLQSSFGPYKTYRSELLVKKKNDNEKIISTKIMQEKSHCSLVVSNWIGSPVEVSQYSNWNALLLDLIPNKTKKKNPKEPRKQPIPFVWYPPKLLATVNPTEGNTYPECVIHMTPAHESAVNTSMRWVP